MWAAGPAGHCRSCGLLQDACAAHKKLYMKIFYEKLHMKSILWQNQRRAIQAEYLNGRNLSGNLYLEEIDWNL